MASPMTAIPSLTLEEEDHIVLARITNDERPLKRVIKKFHNYIHASSTPAPAPVSVDDTAQTIAPIDDAKEAFLVELASFQLLLKKSVMTCEAENRQVEEYQKERQKIEQEHESLKTQIKELKVALEHAQIVRRRKMEYDVVAEKIHVFPSREELGQEIDALENDIAAIRSENETQEKTIQGHKSALDGIVAELAALRFFGRDKDTVSEAPSMRATPVPDASGVGAEAPTDASTRANSVVPTPSVSKEDVEGEKIVDSESPNAAESNPDDDIEMGELEEDPKEKEAAVKKKPIAEELEEGETFDGSSELSEPPDDSDDEL